MYAHSMKKTRPAGASCPRGITFKKTFSHRPRKPPNPGPVLTLGGVTRETTYLGHTRSSDRPGPLLYQCFGTRDRRGDFFNPSLKFAPTGSRTQDLRRCYSQSQELTHVSTNVDAYSHPAYGDTLVVSFSVPSSVAYPVCYTCLTRNSLPPTNRIWNFGYLLHSTCRSSQVAESAGNPIQPDR